MMNSLFFRKCSRVEPVSGNPRGDAELGRLRGQQGRKCGRHQQHETQPLQSPHRGNSTRKENQEATPHPVSLVSHDNDDAAFYKCFD